MHIFFSDHIPMEIERAPVYTRLRWPHGCEPFFWLVPADAMPGCQHLALPPLRSFKIDTEAREALFIYQAPATNDNRTP